MAASEKSITKSDGVFTSRRLLTDAGQVFFETTEALVPSDTNGVLDVYKIMGEAPRYLILKRIALWIRTSRT